MRFAPGFSPGGGVDHPLPLTTSFLPRGFRHQGVGLRHNIKYLPQCPKRCPEWHFPPIFGDFGDFGRQKESVQRLASSKLTSPGPCHCTWGGSSTPCTRGVTLTSSMSNLGVYFSNFEAFPAGIIWQLKWGRRRECVQAFFCTAHGRMHAVFTQLHLLHLRIMTAYNGDKKNIVKNFQVFLSLVFRSIALSERG